MSISYSGLRLGVVVVAVLAFAFAWRPVIELLTVSSESETGSAVEMRTLRFPAVADTYVDADHPHTNYGDSDSLKVDGSQVRESYIKFAVSGVEGTVTAAMVELHVTNASVSSGGSIAQMTDVNWSESEVTYNTRPAISGVVLSTLGKVEREQVVSLDVSQAEIHNGTVSFGLISRQKDAAHYASRERGDGPVLVLTVQSAVQSAPATPVSDPVLVGAGDIASCKSKGDEATAQLLASIPGTIFTAGDNTYPDGSTSSFENCFGPSWGKLRDRIRPSPGNHDYRTEGAAAYFAYFGAAAGNPEVGGYYSYDLGNWHVVVIDSNIDRDEDSPQYAWLKQDLAEHPGVPIVAYWHHARYSSGEHGDEASMDPIWDLLCEARTEIVLTGHEHHYERFAPINKDGRRDDVNGIRQFIVGTGGVSHGHLTDIDPNSEVRNFNTYGVLKLTLHPHSYDWEFIPIAGEVFTDSGSAPTHH